MIQINNEIRLSEDRKLIFASGNFDKWCVYIVDNKNNSKVAPTDLYYFTLLSELAAEYGSEIVYKVFTEVYDRASESMHKEDIEAIYKLCNTYFKTKFSEAYELFCVLYMAMISENLKANAILKKRVKRLAAYQILFTPMSVSEACEFSDVRKNGGREQFIIKMKEYIASRALPTKNIKGELVEKMTKPWKLLDHIMNFYGF